ncbi:hypothetical protein HTX81_10845 [Pseudomonas lini]|uniref:hypothetical protein n=1 Tax=Pseudomonas lini TaxID=163011 RepID=UPI00067FC6CF|nr:hypothetical protein [Pseudomonas lini]NSX09074.1 hypothetical protein [Pseudomonas lini]
MNIQSFDAPPVSASDNVVLVLYSPRIPRGTTPVVGGHLGVPLHIYDLEPMGLEVVVDPYLGQQAGDSVSLNLNGQPDLDSKLTQGDSDATTLYLPKKLLFADFINRLTYTVRRASQNLGTSEPPLELLYNAIRPGKEDRFPNVDGHSELELLLPDAIKNGVGPDFPDAGAQVCVSYPYCRAHDVIRLNCNGHNVLHTVTPGEAPAPGSDTPVTVCFTVTRADLAAGDDNAQFAFSCTVTDQVGNGPDTDSPWSASQIVDVDLSGNRLPAPIPRERLNDPADDPSLIELEKLAGDLNVIALTADNRIRVGDTISATYTAKVSGQPDVVVTTTGSVEADEFGQKKPCVMLVAKDKVITGSTVTVRYQVIRGGVVIASSKTATARVTGQGVITLDPPVPAANPVDPLAFPLGVTVQVGYPTAEAGDQARLSLINPLPGSPAFPTLPLGANGQATFTLDAAFLGAWHGKAAQLRWELIRGGQAVAESGPLVLTVNRIVDADPRFPAPLVAGLSGQELDVTKLMATDQLSIAPWPLQVTGQFVWLRYNGFNSSGAPVFFDDLSGVQHNETQGLTRLALVGWLKALKHDTKVTVTFKVNFGKVPELHGAVIFPVRIYTVKAVTEVPFLMENFDSMPLQEVYLGVGIECPAMTITMTEGGVGAKLKVVDADPNMRPSYGVRSLMPLQATVVVFDFKFTYSSVRFYGYTRVGQGDSSLIADFYGVGDRYLGRKAVPSTTSGPPWMTQELVFFAPGIRKMIVRMSSGVFTILDLFRFTV